MALGSILGGLGAVLSGASGIAGLLGGSKKTGMGPEEALNYGYNSKMYEIHAIKDAAAKYGFHPLALLGNGSFQPAPLAMPDGGSSPWLAGDAVGQALSGLGDLYEQDADRSDRRRERDDVERERRYQRSRDTLNDAYNNKRDKLNEDLVRAQIDEVRSRTKINNARAVGVGAAAPSPTEPMIQMPFTGRWKLAPGTSSASDVQNTLGDLSEMQSNVEQFIWNLIHDPDAVKFKALPPRKGPYGTTSSPY